MNFSTKVAEYFKHLGTVSFNGGSRFFSHASMDTCRQMAATVCDDMHITSLAPIHDPNGDQAAPRTFSLVLADNQNNVLKFIPEEHFVLDHGLLSPLCLQPREYIRYTNGHTLPEGAEESLILARYPRLIRYEEIKDQLGVSKARALLENFLNDFHQLGFSIDLPEENIGFFIDKNGNMHGLVIDGGQISGNIRAIVTPDSYQHQILTKYQNLQKEYFNYHTVELPHPPIPQQKTASEEFDIAQLIRSDARTALTKKYTKQPPENPHKKRPDDDPPSGLSGR